MPLTLENNFWHDIGQPRDYLDGQHEYLKYYKLQRENDSHFQGNVFLDESVQVAEGALIGPNVVIGKGCRIGQGARLKNCTIFDDTIIGDYSYVADSIISWKCKLGNWARVEGLSVFAEEVEVKEGVRVTESMILPQKGAGCNLEKGTILM